MYRRSTGCPIDGAKNGGRCRVTGKVNSGVINTDYVRDQCGPANSDKPGNSVLGKVDDYPPLADTRYSIGSGSASHCALARQRDDPGSLGSARALPSDEHESQKRRARGPMHFLTLREAIYQDQPKRFAAPELRRFSAFWWRWLCPFCPTQVGQFGVTVRSCNEPQTSHVFSGSYLYLS
jgi:hypothetical protein